MTTNQSIDVSDQPGGAQDDQPLCEQLLLLLLNSDGKPVAGRATGYRLAGALPADLVLRGRVDITRPGEPVETGRALGPPAPCPTGDALLDTALNRVRTHQSAEPSTVIEPLSKGTRKAALEGLTGAGIVRVSSRTTQYVMAKARRLTRQNNPPGPTDG